MALAYLLLLIGLTFCFHFRVKNANGQKHQRKRDHLLGGQNSVKNCNWGGKQENLGGICPPQFVC